MSAREAAIIAALSLVVAAAGIVMLVSTPGGNAQPQATAREPGAQPAEASRTIEARLFYVSEDGTRLVSVEHDVPFGEGVEQAREIINAQIAPAPAPFVSAVPTGTTLRALYLTDRGDAYVDLSREAAASHPGGTLNELLTVYTIVDALTVNLPAIQSVQILIEGKEVPTLAGHVDLRQPLAKNLALVQ